MKKDSVYIEYADFRALRHLNHKNIELYLISCGDEPCEPGHSYGPGSRDKYLIHFILSGKGTFSTGGRTWQLHSNQAFIIYPRSGDKLQGRRRRPFGKYIWVGFHGTLVDSYLEGAGININTGVIDIPEDSVIPSIIRRILNAKELTYPNELFLDNLTS